MNDVYYHNECKASWAISAVESLEAALAIENGKNATDNKISINYLLDCESKGYGCVRGKPNLAFDSIRKNKNYVKFRNDRDQTDLFLDRLKGK